ncbi:MAG TPA: methylated-DNA--[protein]-cysteine S-methyltransferase [Trueperaceae bacterium]|nr:methylated-DNA--[protein]-cysteine S-methyltransferase [Trueperaceae bacterium]
MASFRERVLDAVRAVPHGKVVSYGQVAEMVGAPHAARQVGAVLYGLRDEDGDVPWHRVVNAAGGISTYKVGHGELQVALLKAEGVAFVGDGAEGERVDMRAHRWRPELPE